MVLLEKMKKLNLFQGVVCRETVGAGVEVATANSLKKEG
jgi:hypothetical protein